MTRHVAASELEAQLSRILGEVERGEVVAITRDGRTIARIVPEAGDGSGAMRDRLEEMRTLRTTRPKTNVTVDEILDWRHEGHRYR